jgi:hypothetical protein
MKLRQIGMWMLVLCLLAGPLVIRSDAVWSPPSSLGAPSGLAVTFMDEDLDTTGRFAFYIGYSASAEVRAFVDAIEEGGVFEQAGYDSANVGVQIDYKLDDGTWQYAASWDEGETPTDLQQGAALSKGTYSAVAHVAEYALPAAFPDETLPGGSAFFDTHTLHFRMRFLTSWSKDGNPGELFSAWSPTVSFSNMAARKDPAVLINHAPVLSTVKLMLDDDRKPTLRFTTLPAHADLQQLNADSNDRLFTNVHVKIGTGAWQNAGTFMFFIEEFDVDVSLFFPDDVDVAAAMFEVKCRYTLDMSYYPGSTSSTVLSSPFSNTLRQGTPAYSNASTWAVTELNTAAEADLIPGILQGADMKKPITREEFACLAVRLYEKTTGTTVAPVSPNPFTDTTNPEILKAVAIGTTNGTTKTTFAPMKLISREDCAAMLFRTLQKMRPNADYSIAGIRDFPDQSRIAGYAVTAAKYMSKMEIIKGNAQGYFMPKGVTDTEKAAGYGQATREAAIIMANRSYAKMK